MGVIKAADENSMFLSFFLNILSNHFITVDLLPPGIQSTWTASFGHGEPAREAIPVGIFMLTTRKCG
jgi:hypothetical protein